MFCKIYLISYFAFADDNKVAITSDIEYWHQTNCCVEFYFVKNYNYAFVDVIFMSRQAM